MESKTQAIRRALEDRVRRLKLRGDTTGSEARVQAVLRRFRTEFPGGDFGRTMTKEEKEAILGYGPAGV